MLHPRLPRPSHRHPCSRCDRHRPAAPDGGRCGARRPGHCHSAEVGRFAQAVAEVLVGRRDPAVLRQILAREVREELWRVRGSIDCGLSPHLSHTFQQPQPPDGIEVSAVIGCGARSRAFAFRMRRRGDRWICTNLETDIGR